MDNRKTIPAARDSARRLIRAFDRAFDYLGVVAFAGMIVVLCLQIFFRYILAAPLVWATPLSMFLFIWAIWFGGASGIRDQTQVRVELAERYLPHGIQRLLMPGISLACALFLLIVIYKSFEVIKLQSSAIYDTLPFTRDYLFMVVPVLGSVMVLQTIRVFVRQIGRYYFPDADKSRDG
ncbi:MAG: TRAP transporter small permease [Rhodospirillaceae bacterium]|nr:TRAP transporter small permease [Rhodospirillaceae bacterium]